jgi:hypothetical protein
MGRVVFHHFSPFILYTRLEALRINLLRGPAFLTRIRAFEHPLVAPQEEAARW